MQTKGQLSTILTQVPHGNIHYFSDIQEQFEEYQLEDVLADIPPPERSQYPEFETCDLIHNLSPQGKDIREVPGGWELDKYKNLPIKRRLWKMITAGKGAEKELQNAYKWFFLVDTDTYFFLDNVLEFLSHFDPQKVHYFGSPVWPRINLFAHGGSGYVLSYGALKALMAGESTSWIEAGVEEKKRPNWSQFGYKITETCCGDTALAKALRNKGIELHGYWPMFNGDRPNSIKFGREHWCEPVFTSHKSGEEDMQSLWSWEQKWKIKTKNQRALLYQDLFEHASSSLTAYRDKWPNIVSEIGAHYVPSGGEYARTPEKCARVCKKNKACIQFFFDGSKCLYSSEIQVGDRSDVQVGNDTEVELRRYETYWDLERIEEFTKERRCTTAHWVWSNP